MGFQVNLVIFLMKMRPTNNSLSSLLHQSEYNRKMFYFLINIFNYVILAIQFFFFDREGVYSAELSSILSLKNKINLLMFLLVRLHRVRSLLLVNSFIDTLFRLKK